MHAAFTASKNLAVASLAITLLSPALVSAQANGNAVDCPGVLVNGDYW